MVFLCSGQCTYYCSYQCTPHCSGQCIPHSPRIIFLFSLISLFFISTCCQVYCLVSSKAVTKFMTNQLRRIFVVIAITFNLRFEGLTRFELFRIDYCALINHLTSRYVTFHITTQFNLPEVSLVLKLELNTLLC